MVAGLSLGLPPLALQGCQQGEDEDGCNDMMQDEDGCNKMMAYYLEEEAAEVEAFRDGLRLLLLEPSPVISSNLQVVEEAWDQEDLRRLISRGHASVKELL
jgi:hypothetical protein